MVGSKLIESDQDRISFNRNILENAFKRSYGTTPLSKDEKDKVKGIIEKGAHNHGETIDKLLNKGILTPEEAQALKNTSSWVGKTYPFPHGHSRTPFSSPKPQGKHEKALHDEEFVDEEHDHKDDTKTPTQHGSQYGDEWYTETHEDYTPLGSPSSPKFSPTSPPLDEARQDMLDEQFAESQKALDELVQHAYDTSIDMGMTPEEAQANSEATRSYVETYHDYLSQGYSPQEADDRARKIFGNPENIAPNASNLFGNNKAKDVSRKTAEEITPGSLGTQYP
nr:hypothetical protein [Ecytonucleospora hepatopenaei]